MTPQEVLLKGADIIAERGHAKGHYATSDGRVCAIGAMRLATGGKIGEPYPASGGMSVNDYDYNKVGDAIKLMSAYLRDHADEYGYSIFSDAIHRWNDDPKVTGELVIGVMRKAAAAK